MMSVSIWDYEYVTALTEDGVINGYPDGTFGPAKTLTRAEISKIIYLLMKLD